MRRTLVFAQEIKLLEPGESQLLEIEILKDIVFRPERLVVSLKMERPNLKHYQRGVGGSKRKGRLASNRWAIDTLRHKPDRGNFTLDNFHIGPTAQIVGGCIPVEFFSPDYSPRLNTDIMKPGVKMFLKFTNRDHRAGRGNLACFGVGMPVKEQLN